MQIPECFSVVIFGGTGDLSHRKLFPALFRLYEQERFPDSFSILGLGRKALDDASYRESILKALDTVSSSPLRAQFLEHVFFQQMDMTQAGDFAQLKDRLLKLHGANQGNILYYLAISPSYFGNVAHELAQNDLTGETSEGGWKRIILEKPFGSSAESAKTLNLSLLQAFDEDQIYRIDHYLGKETVQNILAFRFANGLFQPLWNRQFIQRVEVTAAESLGVEDRGSYYDTSGALRDMIQNHLLQLLAIIAMEPPARFDSTSVRGEKVKVLEALRPLQEEDIPRSVVRGQYISSKIRGQAVPAYREERQVPTNSTTETYVALKTFIDNDRWAGVPFYIRTGKRLPTRVTEVVIHFKGPGHQLFSELSREDVGENQLVLRIQPDEGLLLKIGLKMPGAGFKVTPVGMDFHYSDLHDTVLPEAYERLILDALLGDNTLFARADALMAAWQFVDPILDYWKNHPETKLYGYPAGTWGPPETQQLFENADEDWRYPCRNLSSDDTFCEL